MKRRGREAPPSRANEPGRGAPAARPARVSRRRFLGLIAAGSAAVAAESVTAVRAENAPRSRRKAVPPAAGEPRARTAAVRAEIEKQKEYLAATLKTVREYPLPAGSDPALVFTAHAAAPRRERRK